MSQPTTLKMYGIYFPDTHSAGYLAVSPLGRGVSGTVLSVLGLSDGVFYARKVDNIVTLRDTLWNVQSDEVRHHVSHPSIPKLISFTEFEYLHPGQDTVDTGITTSSTWEFCNGGTLYGARESVFHPDWDFIQQSGYDPDTLDLYLPEAFLWIVYDDCLTALLEAQRQGISHCDLHDSNVFLHWPSPASTLPRAVLGDFGISQRYPHKAHLPPIFHTPFHALALIAIQGPDRSAIRGWYDNCREDLRHLFRELLSLSCSAYDAEEKDQYQIQRRMRQGQVVNGYSTRLGWHIAQLYDIVYGIAAEDDLWPRQLMQELQQLCVDVHAQRIQAEADFIQQQRNVKNILQICRPVLPSRPAIWANPGLATPLPDRTLVVFSARPGDTVKFAPGEFQVRRIGQTGPGGRWSLLDEDEGGDDDDSPDHGDEGDDNDDREEGGSNSGSQLFFLDTLGDLEAQPQPQHQTRLQPLHQPLLRPQDQRQQYFAQPTFQLPPALLGHNAYIPPRNRPLGNAHATLSQSVRRETHLDLAGFDGEDEGEIVATTTKHNNHNMYIHNNAHIGSNTWTTTHSRSGPGQTTNIDTNTNTNKDINTDTNTDTDTDPNQPHRRTARLRRFLRRFRDHEES